MFGVNNCGILVTSMINQPLLDYVRAQRGSGLSREAIVSGLAAGGWSQNDVDEAFMAIEGVRTPPPLAPLNTPATPRTIVPPIQITQPPQTSGVPLSKAPLTVAVVAPTLTPVSRPIAAVSEVRTAPARKKRSIGSIIALIFLILVVLGLLGLGVLALMNPLLVASYIPQAVGDSLNMFFPQPTQ